MKYEIEAHGETYSFERSDPNVATINGLPVQFEATEPEPGIYLVFLGHRVFEVRTAVNAAEETLEVSIQSHHHSLRLIDIRRRRRAGNPAISGKVELKATMPGRVIRWLCEPGEEVSQNQSVVILEAMKMQNEVRSPKAGVVAALKVEPGQTVEAGVVLAVIE